jgi:hypothetical protein
MPTTITPNNGFISAEVFAPKILLCLIRLARDASQYKVWLDKYNLTIRPAERSGANFADHAIDIARPTFDASETWLASVLIHEAIHFWQYKSGHYQAGEVAESEANLYQLGVLRLLGAPQAEITHMLSQTGGHADLNGDGVYDWQDYNARNY